VWLRASSEKSHCVAALRCLNPYSLGKHSRCGRNMWRAGLRCAGRGVLESLGYRVITAENGREALDVYRSAGGVDLVITDLVMPEMGGRELVRELRRGSASLKAVGITGYTVGEVARDLREAGFLDVIHKPFEVGKPAQTVRHALDAE
jgi:CheY-like chemotaxis protein